jgi:hypothetical protein
MDEDDIDNSDAGEAQAHASRHIDQHIEEDVDEKASDGDWMPLDNNDSVESLEYDHDMDTANEKCGSWPKAWIIDGMSELLVHLYCQRLNEAARAYNVRLSFVLFVLVRIRIGWVCS